MNISHGPATWKNKDSDQPINVIGYLGKHNGRHYVKIEGSETGVPLDEIEFKKTGIVKYNLSPDRKTNKVTKTLEAADKTTRKISGKIHKKADVRGIRQKMIKNAIAKESADWAAKTVEWGRYGIIGTAAVIGITGILDSYNDAQDQQRILKQQHIQERNLERKYKKEQEDRYIGMGDLPQHQGLVQQLFNNRIGHTNSWGGRKY